MKGPTALFIFFAMISLTLAGCGADEKSPEEHLAHAVAFQEAGNIDAAIVELKGALKQQPDNPEIRWLLGSLYLASGDGESAEKELQRSLDMGHDPKAIVLLLARAQLLEGKYQPLLDGTENAPTMSGDDQVQLFVLRGHANTGLGNDAAANELYDMALSLKDDAVEARLGKGQVAANNRDTDKAREWIMKTLAVKPDYGAAWSLLGDVEQYDNNLEEAEEAYGKAIEYNPGSVHDLASRGVVRMARGKNKLAANDVNQARMLNARSPLKVPLAFFCAWSIEFKTAEISTSGNFF